MTVHADGTASCDRCGADIGNAGVDRAAPVSFVTASGTVQTVHFCMGNCVGTYVLTATHLAAYVDRYGGKPDFYAPPGDGG